MDTALAVNANAHSTAQLRQVHTITDRFSMANTYVLNDERMVIVDPGSELNTRLTIEYIQRFLHRSLAEVDLIILTHLHPDHTAGIDALRRSIKAPVAASVVARQMAEAETQGNRLLPGITHRAGSVLPGAFHHLDILPPAYTSQVKLVNIWLNDVEGLPGHPNWRVIASPGHTPESLCLYNPFTYELLCGDTVITLEGGAPLVRGSTNRRQLEITLQTLRSLPIHYLYPGHGRPIISKFPLDTLEIER